MSCKTIPARWEKYEYTKKDSVVYNYSYRDTTIFIPKQIAVIDGLTVDVDSSGKAQLKPVKVKSHNARVTVSIKDSKLQAEGGCDEDSLKLLLKEKDREIYSWVEKSKEVGKTKLIKYTPKPIKYLAILGAVALGLLFFRIVFWFKK